MSTADKLNKILETKADIKLALIDKGLNPSDVFSTYADNIRAINGSIWTGHVDVEGLKAIGWDDEDIAYFQEHGVNWMEEDDEYHKVSEDNKALYGVLTADNIQEYKDRIVYLPKIEPLSGKITGLFKDCRRLVTLPKLDTENVTDVQQMFWGCYSLTCIPMINISKCDNLTSFLRDCTSLQYVPKLDSRNVRSFSRVFTSCTVLKRSIELDYSSITFLEYLYHNCRSIQYIKLDSLLGLNASNSFINCEALRHLYFKDLSSNLRLESSSAMSKESLMYIINHEAATEPITITLQANVYARLSTDTDIIAALEDHPLISLASAE